MVSSYTVNKNIEKPAYNDYASDPTGWTTPVNNDWDIIDKGFGGVLTLTSTSGTVTLTAANYQNLIIQSSAILVGNVIYRIPSGVGGQWIVRNNTTGAYSMTFDSAGGGTSVTIGQGSVETIYSDGTNIRTSKTITEQIPSGLISMWSGSIVSIPIGWLLCDGTSGTPDLRDRFVVGAGSAYAVAATGGSANAILVSHTHTATSAVTDPGHFHTSPTYSSNFNAFSGRAVTGASNAATPITSSTATTGITVATTNSTEGSSGTNANLPPYYALAYIMKM